jgi:hypothetical protein
MKTSKEIANEGEDKVVGQINEVLRGAFYERADDSGKTIPGDIRWTFDSPDWAKKWLTEHPGEVKTEKRIRLKDYVKQCNEQFNNVSNWVLYLNVPEDWGIPGNLLIVRPGRQFLLEQRISLQRGL